MASTSPQIQQQNHVSVDIKINKDDTHSSTTTPTTTTTSSPSPSPLPITQETSKKCLELPHEPFLRYSKKQQHQKQAEEIIQTGWIIKKGRTFQQPQVRYFKLQGRHLHNCRNESGQASQIFDVLESTIRIKNQDRNELEIDIKYPKKKILNIIIAKKKEFRQWLINLNKCSKLQIEVEQFYELMHDEIIGDGINGKVVLGKDKLTDEKIAIKTLPINELSEEEIKIAIHLKHPNLVRTLDVFYDHPKQLIYMIMEYIEYGELRQYITDDDEDEDNTATNNNGNSKKEIEIQVIKQIIINLLHGIDYLHDHGIVHRDIKLENILCYNKQLTKIKLIDFGSSTFITHYNDHMNSQVGTNYYLSPEMIENQPFNQSVDLWALGVVIYILFTKQLPFPGDSIEQYHQNVIRTDVEFPDDLWNGVDEGVIDLIQNLLQKDMNKRYSAKQALNHRWLQRSEQEKGKQQQAGAEQEQDSNEYENDSSIKLKSLWKTRTVTEILSSKSKQSDR